MHQKEIKKSINIIIHIAGWLGIAIVSLATIPDFNEKNITDYIFQLLLILLIAAFFYINYFILVPQLLVKRKIILFLVLAIVLMFCFSLIGELSFKIHFSNMHYINPDANHIPPKPDGFHVGSHGFNPFRGFFIYLINFIVSTGIKMTNEWFKNDRQKRELENDKLNAELSMLKAQINPHFFFNVLNNICSLARSKSEETETYIIKLSQLMRYNLYEQKEDKVLLKKEVQFIEDYIDIQKMRLINTVEVTFNQSGEISDQLLEPMLLFPFIENAFKHGISYDVPSKIIINLSVEQNELVFSVNNTIHKSSDSINQGKGIGLQNVLKRLKLLYADKHEISINNNDNEFTVSLKLKLL